MNIAADHSSVEDFGYAEMSAALGHQDLKMTAAEVHGILSGYLCRGDQDSESNSWYELIAGRVNRTQRLSGELRAMLHELCRSTSAQLEGDQFDFKPFSPSDDCMLRERIDALADWCRGFVLGLMSGVAERINEYPGDVPELVRDIMAISEAEVSQDDDPEGQERALTEIEEYVRVAAQLIYDELNHS